ncbi:MAG: hypothetical protein HY077_11850 [Elusimicrobia bacterium]|nr:hypothetical protein [Elusimicrobiota bacterium]
MLRWSQAYRETELYKAAVRLYTKPVFAWRKALTASTDEKTFYDFARRGLDNIEAVHKALVRRDFQYRPGLVVRHNFNGKRRTMYIYPWQERLVDLLLYRLLNERLSSFLSPHSYAYRPGPFGVDRCQRKVARALSAPGPLYVIKRDVSDYFASVDHAALLSQLEPLAAPGDYFMELLVQRIRFLYQDKGAVLRAERGIPFGTAVACVLANIHLTKLDGALSSIKRLSYFRYGGDLLAVSRDREAVAKATEVVDAELKSLHLRSKPSHERNLVFSKGPAFDANFEWASRLRHLGLEFSPDGRTRLSRDKARKIMNLFRYAWRRRAKGIARLKDPGKRAQLAIDISRQVLGQGVRNVAIVDYYLKHVDDEAQLRLIDRWLAEQVLSLSFGGGHTKGHFRKLSFGRLRAMGLPSLVHRRRLIRHGHIESPFFIWKNQQASRGSQGTAARRSQPQAGVFSPVPEAAAQENLVGKRGRLSMGVIEYGAAKAAPSFRQPSLRVLVSAGEDHEPA